MSPATFPVSASSTFPGSPTMRSAASSRLQRSPMSLQSVTTALLTPLGSRTTSLSLMQKLIRRAMKLMLIWTLLTISISGYKRFQIGTFHPVRIRVSLYCISVAFLSVLLWEDWDLLDGCVNGIRRDDEPQCLPTVVPHEACMASQCTCSITNEFCITLNARLPYMCFFPPPLICSDSPRTLQTHGPLKSTPQISAPLPPHQTTQPDPSQTSQW